jgi:malonate-semialdehyde dehydrogenase (acetylating) / methylmalonate-semialdehyde dehydrogenase
VEQLIQYGVDDGASLLLDGRGVKVPGFEKGNFVGPTILSGVDGCNRAYTEEIFGPVLVCLAVDTLEEAIAFTNNSKYGNGCAIFTQSGTAARKFQHEVRGLLSLSGFECRIFFMCAIFVFFFFRLMLDK